MGGSILSIYDNNGTILQQKEIPVYAATRLGIFNRSTNKYAYELTDNQGNVRAVLNRCCVEFQIFFTFVLLKAALCQPH